MDHFMDNLWIIYGSFMDNLWIIYGSFMDNLWIIMIIMDNLVIWNNNDNSSCMMI